MVFDQSDVTDIFISRKYCFGGSMKIKDVC